MVAPASVAPKAMQIATMMTRRIHWQIVYKNLEGFGIYSHIRIIHLTIANWKQDLPRDSPMLGIPEPFLQSQQKATYSQQN